MGRYADLTYVDAAVADELLSSDMKIVTESDKELSNGIAVKEWGE